VVEVKVAKIVLLIDAFLAAVIAIVIVNNFILKLCLCPLNSCVGEICFDISLLFLEES